MVRVSVMVLTTEGMMIFELPEDAPFAQLALGARFVRQKRLNGLGDGRRVQRADGEVVTAGEQIAEPRQEVVLIAGRLAGSHDLANELVCGGQIGLCTQRIHNRDYSSVTMHIGVTVTDMSFNQTATEGGAHRAQGTPAQQC